MGKNKAVKEQMVKRYGSRCQATGIVTKKVTLHHLEKLEWGGPTTIANGSLLLDIVQQLLHNSIEKNDIELFYLANECFQLYKMCLDRGEEELIEYYETEVMPEYRKLLGIPESRKLVYTPKNKLRG